MSKHSEKRAERMRIRQEQAEERRRQKRRRGIRAKQGRAAARQKRLQNRPEYFDLPLIAVVIILICFGLVMLYSASSYEAATSAAIHDDMFYFRHQAMISIGAVVLALVVSLVDYHIFIGLSPGLYVLSLALMAAVKYSPFGVTAGGATRWLKIGVQFQPSEIAKIAVILIMSWKIVKMGKKLKRWRSIFILFLLGGLQAFGAYYFTDNLSTGIIIFGISFFVIMLAHPKTSRFIWMIAVAIVLVVLFLVFLVPRLEDSDSFRIQRILVWLHPESNLQEGGYQVMQGLYAIGSGGIFGKGLGNSMQKLSTIPEAQNDMIFSIICEELGLFGAVIILILFGYLLYRLIYIAQNAPDLYGTLAVSGIFVHIALQVILNICVVLNVIPTTGVTLPFVSYGGTSVVFLMFEIGIALGVSRQIKVEDLQEPAVQSEG